MKKYDVEDCAVLENTRLAADVFSVLLHAPGIAGAAVPGQFVQVLVPGKTLRRPISLCGLDAAAGNLRLVFQAKGEGTQVLAAAKAGDRWSLLGPLGVGFDFGDKSRRAVFVGGGIGVPPLLLAARAYGKNAVAVTGFRSAGAVILQEDFAEACTTHLATDDGSAGRKGFVTDILRELDFEAVFACGPTPMLKNVAAVAMERGADCQLSLEERMACGVGACLGCAVKLRKGDGTEYYGQVCKDGPVFNAKSVVWEEARHG